MRGASRTYLKHTPGTGWTSAKRIWRASPLQIYPEAPVKVAARPLITDEIILAEQSPQETAAMIAALTPQPEKISEPKVLPPKTPEIPVARSAETPSPDRNTVKAIAQMAKITVQDPAPVLKKRQIIDYVESWRQAWTSKEIEPYIAFYDESFKSSGKDLAQWKVHKAKLNRNYEYISVEISDMNVKLTAGGAIVSFKQLYQSNLFKADGIKTLYLVETESGWKIINETFSD
jgi:hypothetical protein